MVWTAAEAWSEGEMVECAPDAQQVGFLFHERSPDFNTELLGLDEAPWDYVIVHELLHFFV